MVKRNPSIACHYQNHLVQLRVVAMVGATLANRVHGRRPRGRNRDVAADATLLIPLFNPTIVGRGTKETGHHLIYCPLEGEKVAVSRRWPTD